MVVDHVREQKVALRIKSEPDLEIDQLAILEWPGLLEHEESVARDAPHVGKDFRFVGAAKHLRRRKDQKRLLALQRLGRVEQLNLLGIFREMHERIVDDKRLALPVLVLGLEIELDDRLRKQLPLREVRIA